MKRQISTLLGTLGLLLVAACASAQTLNVKANIPFDFVVDQATLPAGTYAIDELNSGSPVLVIRGDNGKGSMVAISNHAESLNASADSHLVFHRYGDQYFLAQIWLQGERAGRQFRMNRREAEIASNTQAQSDVIVLAALR
jgi:hypothetical protein